MQRPSPLPPTDTQAASQNLLPGAALTPPSLLSGLLRAVQAPRSHPAPRPTGDRCAGCRLNRPSPLESWGAAALTPPLWAQERRGFCLL